MPIDIPYTFVAGTKAKAAEVNANFQTIEEFVDDLEIDVDSMTTSISSLTENKANLNGQADEVFAMADAVSDYDGVNLRKLKELTANTKDSVTGFIVAKQDNRSINCTPGACWDTTYTYMIQSSTSLVYTQANLSANATYYAYVTADKETGNCQLTLSLSPTSTEVPSGYDYYRRLATVLTDANGNVETVINDHVVATAKNSTGFIGNEIYNPVSQPATQNLWIYVRMRTAQQGQYRVTVNNVEVAFGNTSYKWADAYGSLIPVKKGQYFAVEVSGAVDVHYYNMES